jgi:hypothetical protein
VNRVEHKVDKVANGLESHLKEHKK